MESVAQSVDQSVKRSVGRCLFERPNRSETERILNELSNRLCQLGTARWNFDFKTSTSLPGRYDWKRTDVRKGKATCNIIDDDNDDANDGSNSICSGSRTSGLPTTDSRLSFHCESTSGSADVMATESKSVSTPNRNQTKTPITSQLKRLNWAPKKKKKTNSLSCSLRRGLRESTNITDYFPIRKRGCTCVRRRLKL